MALFRRQKDTLPLAVIDVETTGLNWSLHDRVCEIGIVLLSPSGEILDIYETLVNPERDLGPTHIHGLDAAECLASPRFEEIAGDVLALLARAGCVAGHSVSFDRQFLGAEFKRLGVRLEQSLPSLCTLRLTRLKLRDACEQFDVPFMGTAHSALADAMATANLIREMAAQGIVDLSNYSKPMPLPSLPPRFTPPIARKAAAQLVEVRSGFLSSLSERVFLRRRRSR